MINSDCEKIIITCKSGKVVEFDPSVWNEQRVIDRLEESKEEIIQIQHINKWRRYRD